MIFIGMENSFLFEKRKTTYAALSFIEERQDKNVIGRCVLITNINTYSSNSLVVCTELHLVC